MCVFVCVFVLGGAGCAGGTPPRPGSQDRGNILIGGERKSNRGGVRGSGKSPNPSQRKEQGAWGGWGVQLRVGHLIQNQTEPMVRAAEVGTSRIEPNRTDGANGEKGNQN